MFVVLVFASLLWGLHPQVGPNRARLGNGSLNGLCAGTQLGRSFLWGLWFGSRLGFGSSRPKPFFGLQTALKSGPMPSGIVRFESCVFTVDFPNPVLPAAVAVLRLEHAKVLVVVWEQQA